MKALYVGSRKLIKYLQMLLDLGAEADVVDVLGNTSLHVGYNIQAPCPMIPSSPSF